MTDSSAPISVSILDRAYQFNCSPEEREALQEAAQLLDGRMREIKASGNLMALERIAVMTALNMCDELLKLKKKDLARSERIDKRISRLADELDDALSGAMD